MTQQNTCLPTGFFCQTVALHSIHWPTSWPNFLSAAFADPVLCDSLPRFGQLQPLPVLEQGRQSYQLMGGYALFATLQTLQQKTAICQIFHSPELGLHEYMLRILLDTTTLQASPVLCAYLLQEAQLRLPENEILALLPYMGYKAQSAWRKKLLSLIALPSSVLLALHQGKLGLKAALQLLSFSPPEQELVLRCILFYQLGGSKQQKLVEMLQELGHRHDRNIAYWLDPWLLPEQEDTLVNRPQHMQNLLRFLHEQCNPAMSRAEKDFASFVHRLKPCVGVQVRHSPCFEDLGMEVSVQFSDRETVQRHWKKVLELAQLASKTAS